MTTSSTPGVYINSKGKKTFIPLENNPAVFTDLIERLGVSSELGFYDVFSIDDEALLSMVPRPVHALIFIAPGPEVRRVRDKYDDAKGGRVFKYDGCGENEPVMWFRQTVSARRASRTATHDLTDRTCMWSLLTHSCSGQRLSEALHQAGLAH